MPRIDMRLARVLVSALALSALWLQPADARRGGSFGSRGSRTYYAPARTSSMPRDVAPIQRSMTTRPAYAPAPAYAPQPGQVPPPRRFGGFGGGLVGGLLAGGLIGGLLGHGMGGGYGAMGGGGGGFLMALIQLALLGGVIWFVIRLFRRNSGGGQPFVGQQPQPFVSPFNQNAFGQNAAPQPYMPASQGMEAPPMQAIAITDADKAAFERLLGEVQDAFGQEDYGRLRERTTPEIMSYLAEELSQNATRGVRNDVTGTRLIDAEVSEAWREGNADYATVAMHYESIDIMRDRTTRAVVEGDPNRPTETTELWTFIREGNLPWKLSAIQET